MTVADDYVNHVIEYMPRNMPRRAQIGVELRGHIAERVASGQAVDDVLRQLGDPVALAESYLAEVPLESAPHGRRIGAKLVDLLTFCVVFAVMLVPAMVLIVRGEGLQLLPFSIVIAVVLTTMLFAAYTVIAEWRFGQTLGKRAFNLRVVRESGAQISLGQSVVRQLPAFFQFYWIDVLFALFTDRRQRAFELLSKTRVVVAKE
jgi:uncharacterized RDD family membrane protein YckC